MGRNSSGGGGGSAGRGGINLAQAESTGGRTGSQVQASKPSHPLDHLFKGLDRTINRLGGESDNTIGRIFGRNLTDNDIADLVGAPDGATITIEGLAPQYLQIKVEHPLFRNGDLRQSRAIQKDGDKIVMHNEYFETAGNAPQGLGSQVFTRQVAAAKRLGVDEIHTFAIGSARAIQEGLSEYNGFYTWARLGYDKAISRRLKNKLSRAYQNGEVTFNPRGIKGTNDLMMRGGDQAAAWWKANGEGGDMKFDLQSNSNSMQVLRSYAASRGLSL